MRKVAIVGAGWAGCAAAVELASRNWQVTLFEAARTPGGRARRVEIDEKTLDNGQHILLGAYTETLRLMKKVGIDINRALLRLPLQMRYPEHSGGMDFIAPRLPAPLHLLVALLRTKGLCGEDKLALARFSTTARWMGWQLDIDCSVMEMLYRFDQTERLIKLMWRPLCIAALNTPPERASARVFLSVLRDSLGARRAASDMLIPRVDLTALFPQYAATYIKRNGGSLKCGATVKAIKRNGMYWHIDVGGTALEEDAFDAVMVATQPHHAATMLGDLINVDGLTSFEHEPITTCYLQYPPELKLTQAFFALIDDDKTDEWGQFVFDRGQLDQAQAGLLAVVVSASSDAIALGHDALSAAIAAQLASVFRRPELAHPQWTKVISEKRATFSCTPHLLRPENATSLQGLAIAGDYTACEYPATLESAVRSGVKAAQGLCR
ncbi:MAG: phytoene dehydrogenase [Burkholderiales bacterium RIFCSPLOWO2_02_FULL_57_36]|nr:MAG: phytoene dehydrogenase [Burkholderiales bacterium RIFCSPLOWO2_02_FULL_57_36]